MGCTSAQALLEHEELQSQQDQLLEERLNVLFANISLLTFANFDDSWFSNSSTTAASSADCGEGLALDD